MQSRLFAFLIIAATMVALGAMAGACGGGGGEEAAVPGGQLSLQDYFQRLEAIQSDAEARSEEQGGEFEEAMASAATEEQGVEAWRDFYAAFAALVRDVIDQLQDIDPPAETAEAHQEFVAAFVAGSELLADLTERLADVESMSAVEQFASEFEADFTTVADRIDQACHALQDTADENGIDADVGCGEE